MILRGKSLAAIASLVAALCWAGKAHGAAPVAMFSTSNRVVKVGDTINFDATNAFDPAGGGVMTYAWNFGDTVTATGSATTHSYSVAGTYIVTLDVTDNGGTETGQFIGTVVVFDAAAALTINTDTFRQNDANNYQGTTDTWINSNAPGTSHGLGSPDEDRLEAEVFQSSPVLDERILIKFDIDALKIPPGAQINRATIGLWAERVNGSGGPLDFMEIHLLTGAFSETTTYTQFMAAGIEGSIVGAKKLNFPTNWDSVTNLVTPNEKIDFDITWAVVRWLEGGTANNGLQFNIHINGQDDWRFSSSGPNPPGGQQPLLTVEYSTDALTQQTFNVSSTTVTDAWIDGAFDPLAVPPVDNRDVVPEAVGGPGGNERLYIEAQAGNLAKRSFIHFDLSAFTLPVGKDVAMAKLILTVVRENGAPDPIEIYQADMDWVTAASAGPPTLSWNNIGSAVSGTLLDARDSNDPGTENLADPTPFEMDVTAALIDWIENGLPNYGFMLKMQDEAGTNNDMRYQSAEGEVAVPADGLGPQLVLFLKDTTKPTAVIAPPSSTTVLSGQPLALDDGGSSDPNGTIVSYDWSASPSAGVAFTPTSGTSTSAVFTTPGLYTETLTVTDNDGEQDTDTVMITVQDASGVPILLATDVIVRGTVDDVTSTVDVDGVPAIVTTGATLSFVGPALSYTGPSQTYTVNATDDAGNPTTSVTVQVDTP